MPLAAEKHIKNKDEFCLRVFFNCLTALCLSPIHLVQ